MSVQINEEGYADQAFFTDVKAVRINRISSGEYRLVVFCQDGTEEQFQFRSKAPEKFPVLVEYHRTDAG